MAEEKTRKKKDSGNGNRKEKKMNTEECISLFMKGLDKSDAGETSSALRTLASLTKEECGKRGKDEERIIRELSSFAEVLDGIRSGNEEEKKRFQENFNPFLGTPEEMLEDARGALCGWKEPVTPLVEGTIEYLKIFSGYPEELRNSIEPYLGEWLMALVDVIHSNITELMEDKDAERSWDREAVGHRVLADFITALITVPGFRSVIDRAFDLFGGSIAEAEIRFPGALSPINAAVCVGDAETFEKLYANYEIRKLVHKTGEEDAEEKEEEDSFYTPRLRLYPEKSLEMLERLYSLGLLLPGTEEGKAAFYSLVGFFNPTREIIERTKHSSYFREDYGSEDSPLVKAVKNPRFPVENYDLLVESPFDVLGRSADYGTLPPIAAAAATGEKKKVEALIALGADISWHDSMGNNIYHRLMGEGVRIESAEELPGSYLLGEKNRKGKTPLEYTSSRSRRAFYNCTPLSFWESLDTVFRHSPSRTPDSLIYMDNNGEIDWEDIHAPFFMLNAAAKMVLAYAGNRYGKEIHRHEDLVKYWKETASGDGRYVLIIPEIRFICPPGKERETFDMIMDLYRRDRVVLFAFTEYYLERLFCDVLAEGERINIYVGKSKTGFKGDMLIGHTGTSALRKSEFLLRCGGSYYVTESYIDDGSSEVNDYPFFPYESEGY